MYNKLHECSPLLIEDRSFFSKKNCTIETLNGTLVDANITIHDQISFRGKGQGDCNCYQNVMEVCDFDIKFTYVTAEQEGIAHDARVVDEIVRDPANNFSTLLFVSKFKYFGYINHVNILT